MPGRRSAHEQSPWMSSDATCAFPTSPSLPPHSPSSSSTLSSSSSPPFPFILDMGISVCLTVANDASANPTEETGPLHDNNQLGIHKQLWTMGQTIFPWIKPREADSFAPQGLEELFPCQIMRHSKVWKRNKPPCIDNKTNSWKAEPERVPFKNFLGAHYWNQALPCFHLSKDRPLYGIVILSSRKLSRCLLVGIIWEKKEKLKWIFQFLGIKYTLDKTKSHVCAPCSHLPLPGIFSQLFLHLPSCSEILLSYIFTQGDFQEPPVCRGVS